MQPKNLNGTLKNAIITCAVPVSIEEVERGGINEKRFNMKGKPKAFKTQLLYAGEMISQNNRLVGWVLKYKNLEIFTCHSTRSYVQEIDTDVLQRFGARKLNLDTVLKDKIIAKVHFL